MNAPMAPLTPRQASVLRAIQVAIDLRRYAPTVAELATAEAISVVRVRVVLKALARKGYIVRGQVDGRALPRALEVVRRVPADG